MNARRQVVQPDAYAEIRQLLLTGDVRPGQRLSHRLIARELNLSRSPVREALLQLEAEGLIEHRPQSGVYLRELSPRDLIELFEIRLIMEPHAAGRAAERGTGPQLAVLAGNVAELTSIAKRPDLDQWVEAAPNRRRLSTLDREFHATILEAAGNQVARQFFETAQILSLVFFWNHMKVEAATLAARVRPTALQHQGIYEAILRRDAGAARRAMKAHLTAMSKRVLASLPEEV